MHRTFMIAAIAAFAVATSFATPNIAAAKSDKAVKAEECAKIADKKQKQDCLAKAKTMATKAEKAGKDAKGKK